MLRPRSRSRARLPILLAVIATGCAPVERLPVSQVPVVDVGARADGPVRVLVAYFSAGGHTESMARAVVEGASSVAGVEVDLLRVEDADAEDVVRADAIVLGSPVYNANVAPPVQEFINRWPFRGAPLRGKIGAAFVTAGGISAGEELTQLALLHSMLIFGMVVVGGEGWRSAFGASGVVSEDPFTSDDGAVDARFLAKGRALGERVARLALRVTPRAGRQD